MKTSTKITSIIVIFFLIIAIVIIGRTMIGNHFKKKFSKRPPPGIIVTTTQERTFENVISTYGTAAPVKTQSFKVEKYEILKPIDFNKKVKKGDVVANLKNRKIIAQFDGVIGKREFSEDLEVSKSSLLINLEDTSSLYCDVDIPEIFVPFIKVGLPVDIKFSGYKNKIYKGEVDSFASRISQDTRSLATRIKMDNKSGEILPGSFLEISIKYNVRDGLSAPDTSTIVEGENIFITNIEATTHNIALYASNTIDLDDITSLNLSGRWNWASLKMEDQFGTALEGHHFFNEFNPGIGSDPDFNMKLWKVGVRIFKGLAKCRVYHFSSLSLRKKVWNNGAKTFLLKWGISIKFFKKHYLKSKTIFKGPLDEPKKNIEYYFDLIICNHVLEHIDDDIKALNEIFRVLKSGGVAILQVPINFKRNETFEDQSIISRKDREKYFGQYDHVREYGLDFKERVEKAGFEVEMVNYTENFSEEIKLKYGLQINDVIPIARKSFSN